MPHGESWFSVIFPSLYRNVEHTAAILGWPVRDDGLTWYAHNPIGVQHVFGWFFVLALLVAMGIVAVRRVGNTQAALVPEAQLTVSTFVELFVGAVYGMMTGIMGPKAARFFLPLVGTCAFIVFFSNALGMVPGFLPPTSTLNTTLACALVIFFATHAFGVKEHGLVYFKHFLGPLWWLAPLMLPIELIGHLARPMSLSIRLMANMAADHLVVSTFLALVALLVPVPMMLLGCLVVVVQTVVFCMLSTVYIASAIEHSDH